MHRQRFEDEEDYRHHRGTDRPGYRKPYRPLHEAAESLFAPAGGERVAYRKPASAPPAAAASRRLPASEPITATVKWYSAERGFGFAVTADGKEIFIGKRALGRVEDLPPGATIKVRTVDDQNGREPSVVDLLDVDISTALPDKRPVRRPAVVADRVERGRLHSRVGGAGFLDPEFAGVRVYIPQGCFTAFGHPVEPGNWLEVEVGQGDRGPRATRILRIVPGPS